MSGNGFTFVNTTNAPGLSKAESKVMRAHVTKANFAARRERRGLGRPKSSKPQSKIVPKEISGCGEDSESSAGEDVGIILTNPPTDPYHDINFLLHEYRALIFPAGAEEVSFDKERAWIDLHLSEPALVEASMVIGLRFRPGLKSLQDISAADSHAYKAVSLVNKHIQSDKALTDGILGAVFTMAFSEYLGKNDLAWNAHVNGLAQMIKVRKSQGISHIPPWFTDLLILDTISHELSRPKVSHRKIVEAFGTQNSVVMDDIIFMVRSLARIRRAINKYNGQGAELSFVLHHIEIPVNDVHRQALTLRGEDTPYMGALSRALEIFLYLSWPPKHQVNLGTLSTLMMKALAKARMKFCSSMDLTTWLFFVGAVSADRGSETRQWFISMLTRLQLAMQLIDGWRDALRILEKTILPNDVLMERFKIVWKEVLAG